MSHRLCAHQHRRTITSRGHSEQKATKAALRQLSRSSAKRTRYFSAWMSCRPMSRMVAVGNAPLLDSITSWSSPYTTENHQHKLFKTLDVVEFILSKSNGIARDTLRNTSIQRRCEMINKHLSGKISFSKNEIRTFYLWRSVTCISIENLSCFRALNDHS